MGLPSSCAVPRTAYVLVLIVDLTRDSPFAFHSPTPKPPAWLRLPSGTATQAQRCSCSSQASMAEPSSPSSSSPSYSVPEGHFQNDNLVVLTCSVLFYGCLLPRLSLVCKAFTLCGQYIFTPHLPPNAPHRAASSILCVFTFLLLSPPLGKRLSFKNQFKKLPTLSSEFSPRSVPCPVYISCLFTTIYSKGCLCLCSTVGWPFEERPRR